MSIQPAGGPGGDLPDYTPSREPMGAEAFDPLPPEPNPPAEIDLSPVGAPHAGLLKPLGADNAKEFSINEKKFEGTGVLGDKKEESKTDTLTPNFSIGGQTVLSDEFEGREAEGQFQVGDARVDLSATLGESDKLTGKYALDEEGARFGLTQEEFIGGKVEAKLESGDVRAQASLQAGLKTTTNGEVRFDQDSVELTGSVEGKLGVEARYAASWDPQGGPVALGSTGQAFAGARAKASGGVEADLTSGVSANVALEAFAGVEGKADATVQLGDSAKAGIGATFKADGEISRDRIGIELDIGATLGIGGNVRFDASIDPMGVIDDIKDVRDLADDKINELRDAAQDKFNEVKDAAQDTFNEARDNVTDAARDKIDDVKNTVNDAKDAAGDMFDTATDTIGGWFD